jgi:hypothetical protein
MNNLKDYFDRVVLINLKRRKDRLADFYSLCEKNIWPFKMPEIFFGIDAASGKIPLPTGWNSGGGAYGCMQAHRWILERAIQDDVNKLLVLEDDIVWEHNFAQKIEKFLDEVPDDWDQLMIGGQVRKGIQPISQGIIRINGSQRTHCYAIRGQMLKDLYQYWISTSGHCDHRMEEIQYKYKVYAPDPFLAGQSSGKSDISGGVNPVKFWKSNKTDGPIIILRCPKEIMYILQDKGLHSGYRKNDKTGIDLGLEKVFALDKKEWQMNLTKWIYNIQWECSQLNNLYCTIWHPNASYDLVQRAGNIYQVIEIEGRTYDEIISKLPSDIKIDIKKTNANYVFILRTNKRIIHQLKNYGWHSGNWREEDTGYDKGLLKYIKSRNKEDLLEVIDFLSREIKDIKNGKITLWHPELTKKEIQEITALEVIEIESNSIDEIENKVKDMIN